MKNLALEVNAFVPGRAISTGPKPGQFKNGKTETSTCSERKRVLRPRSWWPSFRPRGKRPQFTTDKKQWLQENATPPFAIATPTQKLSSHGRRQVWLSSPWVMQIVHWMPFRWSLSYVQNIRINMFAWSESSSYTKCGVLINRQALASILLSTCKVELKQLNSLKPHHLLWWGSPCMGILLRLDVPIFDSI